jgi:glucose-1-phosphate thymidylyltransferase
MRIIIPMAGIGSRLKPHTLTVPKPLTLIAGKPIVHRLVEEIVSVVGQKVTEIGFIIGPAAKGFPADTEEKLIQIAKDLGAEGKVFVQHEALGTAHAIHQARTLLDGPCVVAFADTLFKADFTLNDANDGVIWVKQVDNPKAFGVVKLDNGIITDFVEKPETFVSDLAIIGIYYFKNAKKLQFEIDHLIDNDIKGKGDEYQLTDALENLKQKGAQFVPGTVSDWMDNGNKTVTVETNAKVLNYAHLAGEKLVSDTVVLNNSTIIPPCYVGEHVVLTNTTLGPNVSIGDHSKVDNATIKNALIQQDTQIRNVKLNNAMIGSKVEFDGEFNSISLGDFSQLIKE